MPRPTKGARLYLKKRAGRPSVFVIREAGYPEISTGTDRRREAEEALAKTILERRRGRASSTGSLTVAQVLVIYGEDVAPHHADPARAGYAIAALDRYWGDLPVKEVSAQRCREYAAVRAVGNGTVRRELGVLRAALNYCASEGMIDFAPPVVLPIREKPKQRWLTRREAALLLWAARQLRVDGRHLTRFIIFGLYTGTRHKAALSLRIDQASTDCGQVDTETGILYRQPIRRRETKKRQTEARIPRSLLARIRRWKARGDQFVVQDHEGHRIANIRTGFAHACQIATDRARDLGLPYDFSDVTPHTLRHTSITWALQNGATIWDCSSYFGASPETIERTYGHHSPDHQRTAVRAMERGSWISTGKT